ncbi:cell division protein FtsA [Alkalicoccus daliensis]|uniref:Cell division protein FtsA n=1 Tax=Alkalicoccus daliensis TaxID=745820 RepID=A0A1H0C8Z0_9BACI|nr:cell division protein FtsA [Alkalicoccus daliensis]SDN54286.1 cell division protein FtsA [Alkalicoccus daliensis]
MTTQKYIFGLDIGTRSVVGLLLKESGNSYHVADVLSIEHSERSMLDGQIHNVQEVAKTICAVKETLEEKYGELSSVCVAAAGRSLQTKKAKIEIPISDNTIVDRSALLHLELTAVQKAQHELAKERVTEKRKVKDYCVGYSVMHYELDGEPIGSLIDQQGETASVEVIATFLPKVVVESLLTALQRSGLELEALTLEPIAAINILIPSSMRRLNVALVDIGAGTSDIALTEEGTVTAYGMVPSAGDEITEALSDHFLLDFPEAEEVKKKLHNESEIAVTDILGMESIISAEDIINAVEQQIESLAEEITLEILRLNGRLPKAVMLVGGGSLTPLLPAKIAQKLELPENRVAIRGLDAIKSVSFADHIAMTPELVTPVGIAVTARESPIEYVSVEVNQQLTRLFDAKQLTIADALLASGMEIADLYGKPGPAKMIKLNGSYISIPGTMGTSPLIQLNGAPASLDTPISHKDALTVTKGENGREGKAALQDILEESSRMPVYINNKLREIPAAIYVNKVEASLEYSLQDHDIVSVDFPKTIQEALELLQYPLEHHSVKVFINNKPLAIETASVSIQKNTLAATLTDAVNPKDALTIHPKSKVSPSAKDFLLMYDQDAIHEIKVTFNGEPVYLLKEKYDCFIQDQQISLENKLSTGSRLEAVKKHSAPFIYQDVFTKVTIEQPKESNKKLVTLINNKPADFSSEIRHGDELTLTWH